MSLREELTAYANECINSPDTCCEAHRWACLRFLDDLAKENTPKFPYYFDEKAAERFFRWSTLHRHTKGPLAGQIIEFAPIQRFVFGNVYGWRHMETGYRRFTRAYWQVGRKNAKSQSLAIVGTYELMAAGISASEVYIGATKREQARIIYEEALLMLRRSPELKGRWVEKYSNIRHPRSDSFMRALSRDAGDTADGFNPQAGLIDEYHAHPTNAILSVIETGMGSREEPLIFIITTAGPNLNGPCHRVEYPLVKKILNPAEPVTLDNYFAMINELDRGEDGEILDDIYDEKAWIKANPIAARHATGLKFLREQADRAKIDDEARVQFLTKNLNIWHSSSDARYINMDKWTARGVVDSVADILAEQGAPVPAYVGVDLSAKIDLTSVAVVAPIRDGPNAGQYVQFTHSFLPAAQLERKEQTDKVPYSVWAQQGRLTVTGGEVVDYSDVFAYIEALPSMYNISIAEVCYDPWQAHFFAQMLERAGYTAVEVPQQLRRLSEPTKAFRELSYEGRILHEADPLFDYALTNCATHVDAHENIMLDKRNSVCRIDPVAATVTAFTRAYHEDEQIDLDAHILGADFTL